MERKRFATTSKEEIERKRLKMNAEKTVKMNEACATILREYLKEKEMDTNFEDFDEVKLNEVLSNFYMDVRKTDGSHYKTSSLQSLRYALNRYLKGPPHNKKFDIVKDACFSTSKENFRAATAELKRLGLGNVEHYPSIEEADRRKLYTSLYFNTETPVGLQNKVQFDIRLYFCRRGMENIPDMTKETFEVKSDPKTGLKFVIKVKDELTKNHRENDREKTSGIMPQSLSSAYCPVQSFEKYIEKLHPSCKKLWQKPRDDFEDSDSTWYCNQPVGEKTLASFMTDLSKKCRLSMVYTNHSIRATGATVLAKNMYGNAQIMAVTGHKSVASLSLYQRVDKDDKIRMGQTICESLTSSQSNSLAIEFNRERQAVSGGKSLALPTNDTRSSLYKSRQEYIPPVLPRGGPLPCTSFKPKYTAKSSTKSETINDYLQGVNVADLFTEFTETVVQNVQCPQIFHGCTVNIVNNITIQKP